MPVLLPDLVVEIEAQISRLSAPHAIEQNRVFAVDQATGLVPAGAAASSSVSSNSFFSRPLSPPWL